MPKLSHLKKSFDLLTLEEAIIVVRQTRRDRLAYVPPKAKAKQSYALDGTPIEKAPRAPRTPKDPAAVRKPRATKKATAAVSAQDIMNLLRSIPKDQREAMIAKLGAKNDSIS